jgi:hypothetical protein
VTHITHDDATPRRSRTSCPASPSSAWTTTTTARRSSTATLTVRATGCALRGALHARVAHDTSLVVTLTRARRHTHTHTHMCHTHTRHTHTHTDPRLTDYDLLLQNLADLQQGKPAEVRVCWRVCLLLASTAACLERAWRRLGPGHSCEHAVCKALVMPAQLALICLAASHTHAPTHTRTHARTHTHTHARTHTHIHTHM